MLDMWILKERQNNKKYTKYTIPLLSVTATIRVKENAEVDLDWESSSGLWPLASNLFPKEKLCWDNGKVPPRPLITQKVVHVGEGRTQTQETIEKRRSSVKQLSHFVDSFHWLPAEVLLIWVVTVINSGAESLVLNMTEWMSTFRWTQDPSLG